jgi:hypothetical protein
MPTIIAMSNESANQDSAVVLSENEDSAVVLSENVHRSTWPATTTRLLN